MSKKLDKTKIENEKLDRRVKLTLKDKEEIRKQYATGEYSIRGLARLWNVDRRTIDFTVHPDRLERARQQYKERRKDGRYYNKEAHTESMRVHRNYKRELINEGKIKLKENENKC